jgi:hypothetical protein
VYADDNNYVAGYSDTQAVRMIRQMNATGAVAIRPALAVSQPTFLMWKRISQSRMYLFSLKERLVLLSPKLIARLSSLESFSLAESKGFRIQSSVSKVVPSSRF